VLVIVPHPTIIDRFVLLNLLPLPKACDIDTSSAGLNKRSHYQ